jgi:hypothetical protein
MSFTEDLTLFFDTDEFGNTATYTPNGGSATTIVIVGPDNVEANEATGEYSVGGDQWIAFTPASNVSGIKRGDTLAVNGTTYTISHAINENGVMKMYLEP